MIPVATVGAVIVWTTAFLDGGAAAWPATLDFWTRATATRLSAPRGPDDEFVTLLPDDGVAFLRAQRTTAGAPRVHLDLHVDDVRRAADEAVALGARQVLSARHVLLSSPGGLPFCVVAADGIEGPRPAPRRWTAPDGRTHTSLLDQLAVDVPADRWEPEVRFWQALTGWAARPHDPGASLVPLVRGDGMPLRILLQRLDEPTGAVRAHLDVACDDRPAETARHVGLGAQVERVRERWTVLVDPAGRRYCLTDRDPATGEG